MVIKMACIGGGHGCNAVRYAMDKDSSVTVLRTHGLVDCIFEPTSSDVWNAMKMDISNSHHKVGDALFRIEICPAAEECAGWTDEDWQQCLDDAIRHLNSTPHVGKGGKVLARPTELDRCKWVAAMHHDTDNPHIHLVACRITEDDRVQDSYKCETRALMAADAMARERGWTRAQDKDNERKERIHADAIAVLKEMRQFNAGLFLAEMQGRGWIIKAQRDGSGRLRGYSIGEETRHDGKRTGTVMYKSSQLGHSRDLMISQLENTWTRLHTQHAVTEQPQRTAQRPVPEPYEERTVTYTYNGRRIMMSEQAAAALEGSIILPDASDYYWDAETPDMPAMADVCATAAALFAGLIVPPSAPGGGGSGGSDLPWGRDPREDDREWARRCAQKASRMHTPEHKLRTGRRR